MAGQPDPAVRGPQGRCGSAGLRIVLVAVGEHRSPPLGEGRELALDLRSVERVSRHLQHVRGSCAMIVRGHDARDN